MNDIGKIASLEAWDRLVRANILLHMAKSVAIHNDLTMLEAVDKIVMDRFLSGESLEVCARVLTQKRAKILFHPRLVHRRPRCSSQGCAGV